MAKKKSSNTENPGQGLEATEQPAESPSTADPGQGRKARAGKGAAGKPKGRPKVKRVEKETTARKVMRYSAEQKAAVVQFVRDFDKANRRGGKAAAVKEFGVSSLTVAKWLKEAGRKKDRPGVVPAPGAKPTRVGGGGPIATLRRMLAVREEIENLKAEFERLKESL